MNLPGEFKVKSCSARNALGRVRVGWRGKKPGMVVLLSAAEAAVVVIGQEAKKNRQYEEGETRDQKIMTPYEKIDQ